MRILLLVLLIPLTAIADVVVPIDEVKNSVNIRFEADAGSEIVGRLEQGSSAKLIRALDGWYEVTLEGGASGFISADWSRIVEDSGADGVADAVVIVDESNDEASVVATEAVAEGIDNQVLVADDVVDKTVAEDSEQVSDQAVEEIAAAIAEEAVDAVDAAVDEPAVVVKSGDERPVELKGTRNYLVKFRGESKGGNSQIYDNGNRIGIGTSEPKQRLEVNGSIQIHEQNSSVAGLMITQSSGDTGYIMHNRASTLTIGAGSEDRITVDRDGNVGIAVARPNHPLELASGAFVTSGGVWTNSSSRARKENIKSLSITQAKLALMALEPVTFNYRAEQGENYVGFIAEDVPDLLASRERDAISAMDIVAVLTRVVQEQQKKISALEAKLDKR